MDGVDEGPTTEPSVEALQARLRTKDSAANRKPRSAEARIPGHRRLEFCLP